MAMDTYLCSYFLPHMEKNTDPLNFECMADSEAHAREQLMDAEPNATEVFCEIYESAPSLTEAERDDVVDSATHAAIEVFNTRGITVSEQDYFELNDYLTALARLRSRLLK